MDLFGNLALGFIVAVTPFNLLYVFIGALLGTLIGVLPGLGPLPTIAMLLPITYYLPPVSALIMLAGIYYGASYGGSTTAILVNIPGEISSVVTLIDGHQMARQGRAGAALCVSALGSFFAGCVATLVIAAFAQPLIEVALKFDAAEYFSLMVLGLLSAVVLACGSVLKAVSMIILGLLLGIVGADVQSGMARFSFEVPQLTDGISFVGMCIGLFGFTEIILNLEQKKEGGKVFSESVTSLWLTWAEFKLSFPAIVRGTALGTMLGILPGGGATVGAFGSYSLEKKLAKDPSRFGKGAIEGVAAPESANNAGAQASFIPLLTLGIPSNAIMALMFGALMIHGIQPGPQVMANNPDLFWGLIASMWIGNLALVVLNLPLIGIWVQLLRVPYRLLYPAILLICTIASFTASNDVFEVWMAIAFTILGYVFAKLGCEPAPLLLGFILGPMLEENLRRALVLSRGDFTVFFRRPISLAMLLMSAALLILLVVPAFRKKRGEVFVEKS